MADPYIQMRLETCKQCPYMRMIGVPGTRFKTMNCAVCKCFIEAKARIPSQACPKGYWPF